MSEYEHAGEWSCEGCGETFEVETKLDPLTHALTCGSASSVDSGSYEGYDRRKRELRTAQEAR
jgi:hypothetical protein